VLARPGIAHDLLCCVEPGDASLQMYPHSVSRIEIGASQDGASRQPEMGSR
jgi:hypothetical protein